jgi:hypothetical protein
MNFKFLAGRENVFDQRIRKGKMYPIRETRVKTIPVIGLGGLQGCEMLRIHIA